MKIRTMLSAAALAVGMAGFAMADVTGKVTFEGKAPARKKIDLAAVAQCAALHQNPLLDESLIVNKDAIQNVVISISNPPAGGKVPADPAVLDQKGCQYFPHVLPMMIGQKVIVKNSDPFLHNVHGLPEANAAFNFGQANIDPGKAIGPFKEVEYFRVKCDVHPWMSAHFAVFDHPYFATTGADGAFAIKGLPDGEYNVVAWHEKLGEAEGKVTVKGGKGEVNFSMKMEEASAPVVKDVKISTLTKEEKPCCQKDKPCDKGAPSKAEALKAAESKSAQAK